MTCPRSGGWSEPSWKVSKDPPQQDPPHRGTPGQRSGMMTRVTRGWWAGVAAGMALAGALVASPAGAADVGSLRVSVDGTKVIVTADSALAPFADAETLILTRKSAAIQVSIDEGSARLYSSDPSCTAAPQATPVTVITCTGKQALTGVRVDMTLASVDTQTASTGSLPLEFDGGSGADSVYAQAGADTIRGNAGDDNLFGGEGADTVEGGPGADTVEGESGVDAMYGGPGADDVDAQDGTADSAIDCGADVGDVVAFDKALETPEACDGPFVSAMHPRVGADAGGNIVTLRGRGLATGSTVAFGAVSGKVLTASDTEVTVVTPAGQGRVSVSISLSSGPLAVAPFTYAPAPVLTSASPPRGRAGTVITVTGRNLTRIHRVTVGGRTASFTTRPNGALLVTAPAIPRVGAVDITVVTAGGSATLPRAFTYAP